MQGVAGVLYPLCKTSEVVSIARLPYLALLVEATATRYSHLRHFRCPPRIMSFYTDYPRVAYTVAYTVASVGALIGADIWASFRGMDSFLYTCTRYER